MKVIPINPDDPREDRVDLALDVLKAGGIVALPTETFYGLAGDATRQDVMRRVNALKGKPGTPILLLVDSPATARKWSKNLPPSFDALTQRFWPGPLTLVVPAHDDLPDEVTAQAGTVALRVPSRAFPRRLSAELGRPLSGVSANRTDEPPCRVASAVLDVFGDELDLILDGGPTPGGAPSTIVDLSVSPPRVLREGILPPSNLRPHLPELADAEVQS